MAEKQTITETDKKQDEWYKEAREQTLATLPEFLRKLTEDYSHDYGTICHAIAAGAVGAAWAVERSPCGGITGFQAGAVMWEFIQEWNHMRGRSLRLVDYDEMLYPQYEHAFEKRIKRATWDDLREKAKKKLADSQHASPAVIAHWQSIVDGVVPFGYSVEEPRNG